MQSHYLNHCWNIVRWTLRNKIHEKLIGNYIFSVKKMHLKISAAKWWPFCLSLSVLRYTKIDYMNVNTNVCISLLLVQLMAQINGPRWAPCWPHEPCYQGGYWFKYFMIGLMFILTVKSGMTLCNYDGNTLPCLKLSRHVYFDFTVLNLLLLVIHRYKWNLINSPKVKTKAVFALL